MGSSNLLHITFLGYNFLAPLWFLVLLLVPFLLYFRYKKQEKEKKGIYFTRNVKDLETISFRPIKGIIGGVYLLFTLGVSALIIAMALPSGMNENDEKYLNGIDIMIAMDVSGSMMATDFLPNRLEVAKEVAKDFIHGRTSDKIGFIAFEGEAYTVCPATNNYEYLKHKIDAIQSGKMIPGTAIGIGLGTAVARLRSDSLVSKVVILLTDGENNRGDVSPMEAAYLAKEKNIRVYTIGVGKKGIVKMPIETPFGKIYQETEVSIDEDLLAEMAEMTGGLYFRATDEESLRSIYNKINQMEKNEIVSNAIQKEPPYEPQAFLIFGLICLTLGFCVERLILKENE